LNSESPSGRRRLADVGVLAWLSRARFRYAIRHRIASYQNRVVSHTYGGQDLRISLEDPVGEEWYDHDWPVPPEIACLADSRLTHGARVFDIGAHQGVVALMLARLVGTDGQVVALEAEQHNYEVATRNRDLNGADNLEVLHAAGAASDGWLSLSGGLNGTVVRSGGLGSARTQAFSVDSLAERRGSPDVVFIDVEGFEHEVLSGARHTLEGGSTDFFVEVHVGYGLEQLGGSAEQVLAFFDPARFTRLISPAGSELEDYQLGPLEERTEMLADRFFLVALARD
jgi:FkbM family methyltransferase